MDRADSIPFHIARAYGVAPVRSATPAPRIAPQTPGARSIRVESGPESKPTSSLARLVAGVVPGGVDFSGEAPMPASAMPSLYRHPADRNAAATGVAAGRSVDIQG